tara:strand:+ start:478 stop:861 length:384 start_codon:yes stop_codon:yes gene_type:complete
MKSISRGRDLTGVKKAILVLAELLGLCGAVTLLLLGLDVYATGYKMTTPNARHREAAEIVLATVPQANASLCVALRAIADAWDNVEKGLYDEKLITGLSVQLFKCLDRLGIEADHDVWEDLSRELTR